MYHGSTSRHTSEEPVSCDCGWTGVRKNAIHDYANDGMGDVEPVDRCPECKEEI